MGEQKTRDMKKWFNNQQETLRRQLLENDEDHPGAKGDDSEGRWLNLLQQRLPNRYQVTKGFVVDYTGNQSDEIDVIIYDRQYCPLLSEPSAGRVYVPAESVYAVFEVKQHLDKDHLKYAAKKAQSVRRLERTSAVFGHATGRSATQPKPIFAGILTTWSDWSPAFGEPFQKCIRELSQDESTFLNFGCVIEQGAFFLKDKAAQVEVSPPDVAVISWFFTLLGELQKVGTVPGIEYDRYLANIVS